MEDIKSIIQDPTIQNLIFAVFIILLIILAIKIGHRILSRYIKNKTTRYTARKFLSFIGYLLAGVAIITIYNYELSSLTIALGVASAGIAFALQEVIVSVAGFLAILFGNFYKAGDRVKLGGIKGDVVDIGVLRTTLMEIGDWVDGDLYNGKMVRVANSFIFKEPVFNYSGDFPFLWDEIKVPLKHNADVAFAKDSFQSILEKELGDYAVSSKESWEQLTKEMYVENAQIDPMVTMAFDENWITFTLRYVVDFKKRRKTKNNLFTEILNVAAANSSKMSIASAAFEITAFPGK
ncbi:MAG: mechanosensitive ion channel [Cyclobacteriaceae bacterium]